MLGVLQGAVRRPGPTPNVLLPHFPPPLLLRPANTTRLIGPFKCQHHRDLKELVPDTRALMPRMFLSTILSCNISNDVLWTCLSCKSKQDSVVCCVLRQMWTVNVNKKKTQCCLFEQQMFRASIDLIAVDFTKPHFLASVWPRIRIQGISLDEWGAAAEHSEM